MNAATLKISIEVDDKGSVKIRQLGRTTEEAGDQADRSFRKAGRSLGDFDQRIAAAITKVAKFMTVTLAAAAAAGTAALALVSRQAVKLASDLEETQNKFNVVFRGMTGQAEAWAKTLQDSYIMTREESKRYLASIQDLLVPMGMAREAAGKLSFEIVKLSADLGSFNNVPTADVMLDIQSALVGNYETMKKYGVVINAALVEEKALAMGLAATKKELTAAHKAQAAYQLILAGSADAIGDIERSSGSYANQMRLLNKNITELKTTLGEALLPVLSKMLVDLNNWIEANKGLLRQNITAFAEKLVPILQNTARAIGWIVEQIDNWIEGAKILGIIEDDRRSKNAARIKEIEKELRVRREIVAHEKMDAETRLLNAKLVMDLEEELLQLTGQTLQMTVQTGEAATEAGAAQVQAAEGAAEALGKLDRAILDTGRSYNLQVAAYMEGTDELTRNIIDRSDQIEAEERERMARVNTAVEEFYGDIYKDADDHADKVKQLNELLVNDLGRIFDSYINDVLHGQIRSVKDLFEGLFKSILDMFARMLSQMAANSLVDALFGKGASGGLTLSSLTSGGGLLGKILSGSSLVESAVKAGKWVAGLLGLGAAAHAPALLAPGAAGAALYPAVGVGASGTGYAIGMGGLGAGGAASATPAVPAGGGIGFGAAASLGIIGAAALGIMYFGFLKDKKPSTTELMNQMGLKPEDYAFAIGTVFTEAMDPVYGVMQHQMATAGGRVLTTWNQFETEFRDVQTRIYNTATGQWEGLALNAGAAMAMLRGEVISELDAMAVEAQYGVIGLAEHLIEASRQSQSAMDKARSAMKELGVTGAQLARAMELAERATAAASGSTAELESHLAGLGVAEADVAEITAILESEMFAYNNRAEESIQVFRDLAQRADDAAGGLDDLAGAIDRTAGSADQLIESLTGITAPAAPAGPAGPGEVVGNAAGGLLRGGSGLRDDLYLGTIGGRAQLAMGGEYIVNRRATARHLALLERINADTYLLGGQTPKGTSPETVRGYVTEPPLSPVRTGDAEEIAAFMEDILFSMAQMGRTGFDRQLAEMHRRMAEAIETARELGASEQDLADIRKYEDMQALEIAAARRKAKSDFMQSVTDQIAAYSMTDQEQAILATVRAMERSLEAGRELGLTEKELAKIRELQALQAEEIANRGLKTAVEAMSRFRLTLQDAGAEAVRSADAQQRLFDILGQARQGDFSGVEAIGDVLKDISINKADYATAADYARDYWRTMRAVADLEQMTGSSINLPGYATGGEFAGGWRIVGERGPELEYTGPSVIFNRGQSRELIDLSGVVDGITELRREVAAIGYQLNKNTGRTARWIERWEAIGLPAERAA